MTRPRVSPEKRQRTERACDSCKRRKQKCNGLNPCNTCFRRSLSCSYSAADVGFESADVQAPPAKRQVMDKSSNASQPYSPPLGQQQPFPTAEAKPQMPELQEPQSEPAAAGPGALKSSPRPAATTTPPLIDVIEKTSDLLSRASKDETSYDEEAVVYTSARMLEDPTGRLLYVGDSGTLSYLQLIRMIVESIAGPSPFTLDPRRHRIVENTTAVPLNMRNTYLLPDKTTALVLVDSFFVNTSGLVEIFNRKSFMATLDHCYSDPLHVDPSWLCLLHLTFAIGLVLATPLPGTRESRIIQTLRSDPINRADVFYSNAKNLSDPTAGFEDADFWSVQALLLMTLYTLAVSKRNAAFAYCGMAIRSAVALGLHREETLVIFSDDDQTLRRNLWRSLFVLDSFLSASLGRPTAISEDDCSGESLRTDSSHGEEDPLFVPAKNKHPTGTSLEASLRSSQVISIILRKVYSKRKISTGLAQEIADKCKSWSKELDASLHWRQMATAATQDTSPSIAILHVNLIYCHTIILLTRPFFLFLLNKMRQERSRDEQRPQKLSSRMEKFSEACVIASCHTIILVQNALEGCYLSRRDPFVIYFLFAAALIVLSNEFSRLYDTPGSEGCIRSCIRIMSYCAETDPLADRLLYILTSFRDVVDQQKGYRVFRHMASTSDDPILDFFNADPAAPENSNFVNQNVMGSMQHSASFSHSSTNTHSPQDSVHRHGSGPGIESEGEIEFETFWRQNSQQQPGNANGHAPRAVDAAATVGLGNSAFNQHCIQGISDSMVPLYGMLGYGGG